MDWNTQAPYLLSFDTVAPLVGAWIEIEDLLNMKLADMVAPLVGAWNEILLAGHYEMATMVAPLVGAWIEILA